MNRSPPKESLAAVTHLQDEDVDMENGISTSQSKTESKKQEMDEGKKTKSKESKGEKVDEEVQVDETIPEEEKVTKKKRKKKVADGSKDVKRRKKV